MNNKSENNNNESEGVKYSLFIILREVMNGITDGIKQLRKNNKKLVGGNTTNVPSNNTFKNNIQTRLATQATNKESKDNPKLNETISKLNNFDDKILNLAFSMSQNIINEIIDILLYFTGNEDILNKSQLEINTELKKKILLVSTTLNNISNNPETLEAISEIFKAITILIIDIIDEIKPELDLIVDDVLGMTHDMGLKAAHSLTITGIAMLKLALNESVPFVGPLISAIHSLMNASSRLIEMYTIYVNRSSKHLVKGMNTYLDAKDKYENGKKNINKRIDNAQNTINKIFSMQGGNKHYKNNKPKILKTKKRLRKTMKMFQNKSPRIKYSNFINNNKTRKH
jgi:hypothetical protein